MLIKKIHEVPPKPVEMQGVKDVKVRVIFGPKDNAPTFAMRVFDLAPSGHTPFHTHPFEHQAMILSGDIALIDAEGKEIRTDVGDVALVMPEEKHQFKNLSDTETASFMCLVPIEYQA